MPNDAQQPLAEDIRKLSRTAIGRQRVVEDVLDPDTAEKLALLLRHPAPDEHLPPTYHWAYFNKGVAPEHLGRDLHERTGLFLPAVPFDRRMWAAGDVTVLQPLRVGVPAQKHSTVTDVAFKQGRTGNMCFVTVAHQVEQDGVPCITETQTIVYRDRGAPEAGLRQHGDPVPEGHFLYPDSQLWFYSALTYNGHRIHWDRAFCRDVEGYPDLVVQGPLMATQLCEEMRTDLGPMRFAFRAQAPVFATTPVRVLLGLPGDSRHGEIKRSDGVVSMTATMTRI